MTESWLRERMTTFASDIVTANRTDPDSFAGRELSDANLSACAECAEASRPGIIAAIAMVAQITQIRREKIEILQNS